MGEYLGPGNWGEFSKWERSDCWHLREMVERVREARSGEKGSDVFISLHLSTFHWLIDLENRVRAMEGRDPVRVDDGGGDNARV